MVAVEKVGLPSDVVEVLRGLEKGRPLGENLRKLLAEQIRSRIFRYEVLVKTFQGKYGMSFKAFDKRDMVEKLGHKWDVERDYFDWELAETELPSLRRALRRLRVED